MLAELDVLSDFRGEVRRWCEANVAPGWRSALNSCSEDDAVAFQRAWFMTLHEAGYAAPHWSREWGGSDSSLAEQIVLFQELSRADAPRASLAFIGLFHTYATLIHAGTNEQKQRHLPAVLDGTVWCQGFSEPEAGSDLAGLRTRAVRDGGRYVVNGQKIWSSGAAHADWCLLLARTDPDVPKRKGISYFLLDMRTPGVEVRPIRQASGDAEFCELFLNDVVIPAENLVGAENDGWRIAQATLSAERGPAILELAERMRTGFEMVLDTARHCTAPGGSPALADPEIRDRLVRCHTEVEVLNLLCLKMIENLLRRGGVGPEASIIKTYYSELLQRLTELAVELSGLDVHVLASKPRASGWISGEWLVDHITSWEWTIAGGTNEIQRNLISERVLGLPREPGMD